MKLKIKILSGLIACSTFASAQNLNLELLPPAITMRQDSAIVTMKLTVSVPDMDPKSYIRLTPILSDGNYNADLPQILLNGERAHRLYRRNLALNKRRGKPNTAAITAIALKEGKQSIDYRASLPAGAWINQAELTLKKEVINANGDKIQSENLSIPNIDKNNHFSEQDRIQKISPAVSLSASTPEHRPVLSNNQKFKGSYISPQSDATDERNQKELNFSLDEACVVAEINPQMLSLRELYTVALSYKNIPERFYKIIDISVKIYPASPVANLNAAAAAIERGNTQTAGRYLQMASHETLAYKNCRGTYELLCNNTYEGIRLLKAAQAEGSEEASYNLKMFFGSNQTPMP